MRVWKKIKESVLRISQLNGIYNEEYCILYHLNIVCYTSFKTDTFLKGSRFLYIYLHVFLRAVEHLSARHWLSGIKGELG